MHPVFLQIGSFYIGTYGVLLAIALIFGTLMALNRAKRVGIPSQLVMDLIFWVVVGGIVGGRLAHIIVHFDEFCAAPLKALFSRYGFVFLGSVAGALVIIVFVTRRHRINLWAMTDVLVTALPLGHAFGRLGCLSAGCCYGRPLDPSGPFGFLAIRFPCPVFVNGVPMGSPAFADHVADFGLDPAAAYSLPVWPVQILESVANLLIFAALVLLWRRRAFAGQIFLAYLVLYSIVRFAIEFLRGDAERGFIGPLSISQALCLLAFCFALIAWRQLARTPLEEPANRPPEPPEAKPNRAKPTRKKRKRNR